MSVKSDRWIRRMALEHGMISPFSEKQVRAGTISFGLSSYGYDIRVADEFKLFTNVNNSIVDPKNFDDKSFVNVRSECAVIPPNSFALARSVERFNIPRNVVGLCVGKSTYARCGIIVNVTPFEPEWRGIATLEITNSTNLPAHLCKRGALPNSFPRFRRVVRGQLRRPQWQVSGSGRNCVAQAVVAATLNCAPSRLRIAALGFGHQAPQMLAGSLRWRKCMPITCPECGDIENLSEACSICGRVPGNYRLSIVLEQLNTDTLLFECKRLFVVCLTDDLEHATSFFEHFESLRRIPNGARSSPHSSEQ
jgi:dCTP deaminase